ncbi:RDD family protein [Stutzerimonas zhaodongensis]|uniref:RDD family protein n=1 Tax=Stutzerimonas zhaodongensis TaxID=1176257 RepID=A0A3M2I2W8_9GAMM|nr:RDD family protein [Stutzerimonas zhaodongensis]MCQ4316800.1 RDD family protein [Stutzerimonas zhaodongensis]RMH92544.1 RDD family protein [Stutzerimonas zhaodongensis]
MRNHLLSPQGQFPAASLIRRIAAICYDAFLAIALMMVVTLLYQQVILRFFYGSEGLKALAESGGLDIDPFLSTLLLFAVFAFFAKFWTHNGQTLGMQVWGVRIQNADGTAIDLWQALLRFLIAIMSWLALGLGYWWMLWDKQRRTWQDIYSESQVVQLPKNIHKK